MPTHRLRHIVIAALGGAALAAALLFSLSGRPAAAQAAASLPGANGSGPFAQAPVTATSQLFMPLVTRQLAPCSAAPLPSTPTNGSLLNTLIPTLTYLEQTTAVSSSRLYLSTHPDYSAPNTFFSSGGGPGPVDIPAFNNLQPATTYYWRVQDFCSSGAGPVSTGFTFTTGSNGIVLTAPFLISPISGTVAAGLTMSFTWTSIGDATGYAFLLDSASGSDNLSFVTGNAITDTQLSAGTTYTWFVQAISDYAYGAESDHWTFSTGTLLAARPGAAPQAEPVRFARWLGAAEELLRH